MVREGGGTQTERPASGSPRTPAVVLAATRGSAPGEQGRLGIGQEVPDVAEEARTELPVDDPMVERQPEGGHLTHLDLALVDPRRFPYGAEREDRRLAGRQDRRTGVDTE